MKREIAVSIFILMLGLIILPTSMAVDNDNDGIDDEDELMLAKKYAPIFYFEKNEELFPVSVEYHISNSNLNMSTDNGSILISTSPTSEILGNYTDADKHYYLDNRIGGIYDDRIIEDYKEHMKQLGYTIYCRVFKNEDAIIIQYWLFYAFNKGTLNTHEGDWEMVEVITINGTPVKSIYSQHITGQAAEWKDVEKSGEHIKVYVARGSHANYFRYYQGLTGLARDIVGKNGKILHPDDYNLVMLGERGEGNHPAHQNWLDFAGGWGEYGDEESNLRGERGPYGPVYRMNGSMWNGYYSTLTLNKGWLAFDFFVYNFIPIYAVFFIISMAVAILAIYIRHKRHGLEKPLIPILNIHGMDADSISSILAIAAIIMAIIAAFSPWYGVFAEVKGGHNIDYTKIISMDGIKGVEINTLEAGKGMIQVGALPIPFSTLMIASLILFIIGITGIKKRKLWRKYVMKGIRLIIPAVLILIAVISLQLIAFEANKIDETGNAAQIMEKISSSPLSGEGHVFIEDYGDVNIEWGMEYGSYLFILAGIMLIIAGMLQFYSNMKQQKVL